MRPSFFKRLVQLAIQPRDAWATIASEPGHPAAVLLPAPAVLVAVGPLCFLIGHCIIGRQTGAIPLGRGLGFAIVYYTLLVALLIGQAQLLQRFGATLGTLVGPEDGLKLSVWASIPFHFTGLAFLAPADNWDSIVVVAGLVGLIYCAIWLYQGLGIVARGDNRSRGLLAAAATGAMATLWILGLYLLIKILL